MKGGEVSILIPHPLSPFGETLAPLAEFLYGSSAVSEGFTVGFETRITIYFTFTTNENQYNTGTRSVGWSSFGMPPGQFART